MRIGTGNNAGAKWITVLVDQNFVGRAFEFALNEVRELRDLGIRTDFFLRKNPSSRLRADVVLESWHHDSS